MRYGKFLTLFLIVLIAAPGCTSAKRKFVVFPMQQQDPDRVAADRAACEAFASDNRNNDEALQNAGMGALLGAGTGALNGAVQGAFRGAAGQGAGIGAAVGAAIGLSIGVVAGIIADHQRYLRIYAMCMQLRGYSLTSSLEEFGFPPGRS